MLIAALRLYLKTTHENFSVALIIEIHQPTIGYWSKNNVVLMLTVLDPLLDLERRIFQIS